MDLGGRTITIVTQPATRYKYAQTDDGKDDPDKTAADTIEIINTLKEIEKDYNCTINVEIVKGSKIVDTMLEDKAAGDNSYDILDYGVSDTYLDQLVGQGLVMDMNDPRIKDIIKFDSNPWSKQSDYALFNDIQYGVQFDTNNTSNILRNALLFNIDLAEQYGLGDLYGMVKDGTWTWAKFEELCESIAQQSDGSVVPAGYGKENLLFPMVVFSNDASVAEYRDGKLQYTMDSDNALEAANWIVSLREKGYLAPNWTETIDDKKVLVDGGVDYAAFAEGKAVFFFDFYGDIQKFVQGTQATEYTYGLLPCPLGPKAVEAGDTYHGVTYSADIKMISAGTEKPEEVAAILVAIANRCVKHDIENTELKNNLMDEGSKDMVMIMYNDMRSDYSRRVKGYGVGGANNSVLKLEKTPAQAYGEIKDSEQALYDASGSSSN